MQGTEVRLRHAPLPRSHRVGKHRDAPAFDARTASLVTPRSALATIGIGGLLVTAWPVMLAVQAPQPASMMAIVARASGMLAGFAVLVLIALMARSPALERGIGADVLSRWHSAGACLVVCLALLHAATAVLAQAQSRHEEVVAALWRVLRLPGLMVAAVGTSILLVVGGAGVRAARRRLSDDAWRALRLWTYVAVALVFAHELAGPDLAGHRWLQIAWALLYALAVALVLRHSVLAPLRHAVRHRLRIAALMPRAPEARRTRRDVLLIAGGMGITPLRTLFETLPLERGQDLRLLYRARGPDYVLFRNELEEIARRRGATLRYLFDDDPDLLTAAALRYLVPNLCQRDVYLCGPPPMAQAVRQALREAGLPPEQLHEERFSL